MIPFTDIAIIGFVRNLLPTGTVITWAPPEVSRQGLANQEKQESIGYPGVAVFRVDANRDFDRYTKSQASIGFPIGPRYISGASPDIKMLLNKAPAIAMKCEYTIATWTRTLHDRNNIDRALAFADVYKEIHAIVKAEDDSWNFGEMTFPVLYGEVEYDEVTKEESGEVLWYSSVKTLIVDSFWIHHYDVPYLDKIQVVYQKVTSGDPFDITVLDTIVTVPKP